MGGAIEGARMLDGSIEPVDRARPALRRERALHGPRVSIVVPAYNEERRLGGSLRELASHQRLGDAAEVILVDDGSEDRTVEVAREHLDALPRGRLLRLPWHAGKGAAVRLGVAAAQGDAIVFMDADLATDLEALPQVLEALGRADVVIGSRAVPGAVVTGRSWARGALHRGFGAHARRVVGISARDTQCGFKAFRSEAAKILFPMSRLNGFGFDVEILMLASRLGYRILEVPVCWRAVEGSHVRARDPVAMLLDVLRMRLLYLRKKPLAPPER